LCAAGGLAALTAATVLSVPAFAAKQQAEACTPPVGQSKTVFPPVAATDYVVRWPIIYHSGTRNHWPGTCGGWRTTYTDYRGPDPTGEARTPTRDFAQVSIVVLSSRRAALAAYRQSLPDGVAHGRPEAGALMKSRVLPAITNGRQHGEMAVVISLVRNIVVISSGEARPADNTGAKTRRDQERVHRGIQRNAIAIR